LLQTTVKPLVESFLLERGLVLSPEKTVITHVRDGFDFLGQNIRRYPTQCGYIYGSVEDCGLHLANQRAVDVLDLNATLDKTFRGLRNQTVLLVFRNREVQSALDGFGFRLGMQRSLGALDLRRVQLKVFVGSFGRCRHWIASS
jgi:hypothetical protein